LTRLATSTREVLRVPIRRAPSSLHDRLASLLADRASIEAEAAQLRREVAYVADQVRLAKEQVRHYEGLLTELRKEWGGSTSFTDLVRRLG
jgi:hypothetical protein